MVTTRRHQAIKFVVGGALLVLALLRVLYPQSIGKGVDSVVLGLVLAALLLLFVPIERLQSLKAGGIEISLDKPQVQGAIATSGMGLIQNAELRSQLLGLADQLGIIPGSRVLWIDDNPHTILGERRILRALGVEIVQADSSMAAERVLKTDNDFDLLITDVQRPGGRHEGVDFVGGLRKNPDTDHVVRALPVVFYTFDDKESVAKWAIPWREVLPSVEIANSAVELVPKVVRLLAGARLTPVVAPGRKLPTYPGGGEIPTP